MSTDFCNWPVICEALKYNCEEFNTCFSKTENKGPDTRKHSIHTDYSFDFFGNKIPIIKTDREFLSYEEWLYGMPKPFNNVHLKDRIMYQICEYDETKTTFRIKEDCSIIKSTLCYLDQQNKVLLYRKNIENIKFDLTTSINHQFKGPWGLRQFGAVYLYGGDSLNYDNECLEEWHLVINGTDRIISTTKYFPIAGMEQFASGGSDVLFDPSYKGIKDLELVLLIGVPSSDEVPWDDVLRYHGFYNYKGSFNSPMWEPDGYCGDYYYPAWCRELQPDPCWQDATEIRRQAYYGTLEDYTSAYTPPAITVDPLPRGTFVKHPLVGEVWQFLVDKRDGSTYLETSPNVDTLIKASLERNGVSPVQGTMLYYPIGV